MEKRTMADFFREIKPGMVIKVQEHAIKPQAVGMSRRIEEVRTKSLVSEGGFRTEKPRACLLDYDGYTFTIYQAGIREVTQEEKEVYQNMPGTYHARKDYLRGHQMEYLNGESIRGLGKLHIKESELGFKIQDENIRGPLLVKYAIIGVGERKSLKDYYMQEKYSLGKLDRENYVARGLVKLIRSGLIKGIIYNGRNIDAADIKGVRVDEMYANLVVTDGTEVKIPDDKWVGIRDKTAEKREQIMFKDRVPQETEKVEIIEIEYK